MRRPPIGPSCPHCGLAIVAGNRFCPRCGAQTQAGSATPVRDQMLAQGRVPMAPPVIGGRRPFSTRRKVVGGVLAVFALGCFGLSAAISDSNSDATATVQQQVAQGTRRATPEPTATQTIEQVRMRHARPSDAREVFVRSGDYENQPIQLAGSITQIQIAPAGQGYELGGRGFLGIGGDTATYRSALVVQVESTSDFLVVGFNGDLPDVYEGDVIQIYGQIVGVNGTTNAFGGSADRPLFEAVLIEHDDTSFRSTI